MKLTRNKSILSIAIFSIGLLTNTAIARDISHTLTLTDPSKPAEIDIELMVGSILVEGYKGNEVIIEGSVKPAKEDDHVRAVVRTYTYGEEEKKNKVKPSTKGLKKITNTMLNLEIEEDDNEIQIESHSRTQHVDLRLKVPFNANLELGLHSGESIVVKNVHGEIEIEAVRAPITATGIKGPIVAEGSRSDLKVIFDEFNTEKPSSLTVHRGNIDITLPKKASADVQVKSYEGDLYSGLDAEFKVVDQVNKSKNSKKQKIVLGGAMSAKINGGKQKVLLNTYRGDVYIRSN
jgi:hypothetical protein